MPESDLAKKLCHEHAEVMPGRINSVGICQDKRCDSITQVRLGDMGSFNGILTVSRSLLNCTCYAVWDVALCDA